MKLERPIIFFDGVCILCNTFIDFVFTRDHSNSFYFAPLQGKNAKMWLADTTTLTLGPSPDQRERENLETLVYLDEHGQHIRSDAVLSVLVHMGGPYRWFGYLGRVVPRIIRDGVYNWIAHHRYNWFGKRDACRLPTPEDKHRLLD